MRKHLKKYFIPHEENDYKPHFLQEASVAVTALIVVALFLASFIHVALIVSDKDFLAAILPGVLVDLTNEERQDNNLGYLQRNPLLDLAAQQKARHMAENSYFAHNSPDGLTPWYWFYQTGYQFQAAGENLAVNFSDSDQVVRAWMESPGHRANILNGGFTEIGMAMAEGEYNGKRTIFVVQLFGTPMAEASVSTAPTNDSVAGTQATSPDEEITGEDPEEIVVESQGPIAETEPEEDTVARADIQTLEVTDIIEQNDSLYIAVRDPNVSEDSGAVRQPAQAGDAGVPAPEETEDEIATTSEEGTSTDPVLATVGNEEPPQYSGMFARLASRPQLVLNSLYLLIGLLIIVSLVLSIGIEFKHHHPMGVAYGAFLLLLIGGLTYLNQAVLFSSLIIV
jgi:hypothetical protein